MARITPDWDYLDAADDAEVTTTVTSKAAENMKASAANADAARAWERWVDARPNVTGTLNRTEGASIQARRRIRARMWGA